MITISTASRRRCSNQGTNALRTLPAAKDPLHRRSPGAVPGCAGLYESGTLIPAAGGPNGLKDSVRCRVFCSSMPLGRVNSSNRPVAGRVSRWRPTSRTQAFMTITASNNVSNVRQTCSTDGRRDASPKILGAAILTSWRWKMFGRGAALRGLLRPRAGGYLYSFTDRTRCLWTPPHAAGTAGEPPAGSCTHGRKTIADLAARPRPSDHARRNTAGTRSTTGKGRDAYDVRDGLPRSIFNATTAN